MSNITIEYIAGHLGLSKFAVSRALSGKTGVSDSTRALVLETATGLGYISKPRTKRSTTDSIEILFHDPEVAHRGLWMDVQAGAQSEGARLGVTTAVRWTDDPDIFSRLKQTTTGFILIGPHEPEMIAAVRETGLPCVKVGPLYHRLEPIDQIGQADREAAGLVAEHLLGLGHRTFVYVHGKAGYSGRIERLQSFANVVNAVPETALREMAFPEDDKPTNFRELLKGMVREKFLPTAFFCGNDGVAVTVVSELMRIGIRIPEDVSVVGYADYPIATQIAPRLTTVRSPHREMGVAAVRVVLSRCGRYGPMNDLPPFRLSLAGQLVVRESCGPASIGEKLTDRILDLAD